MNIPFARLKVEGLTSGFTSSGEYYNRKFRRSEEYAMMMSAYLLELDKKRLEQVKVMIEEKSKELSIEQ